MFIFGPAAGTMCIGGHSHTCLRDLRLFTVFSSIVPFLFVGDLQYAYLRFKSEACTRLTLRVLVLVYLLISSGEAGYLRVRGLFLARWTKIP